MRRARFNLRAILVGSLIVLLINGAVAVLGAPFEIGVLKLIEPGPKTPEELVEHLKWPGIAYYSAGIVLAYGVGTYVAARSAAENKFQHGMLAALIPLCFLLVTVFLEKDVNSGRAVGTLFVALTGSVLGSRIASCRSG